MDIITITTEIFDIESETRWQLIGTTLASKSK